MIGYRGTGLVRVSAIDSHGGVSLESTVFFFILTRPAPLQTDRQPSRRHAEKEQYSLSFTCAILTQY